MAPSRRQISGRSPLVNQQRQITSFFGKSASSSSSPSPSPAPSLSNKKIPKFSNPNPNSPSPSPSPPKKTPKLNPKPSSNPPARSPSPGPATPSPVQSKFKKPLLVIGQAPSPPQSAVITYGDEVVGKQVRVYWPLDKKWYDGSVTFYDKGEGKHVVEYEDGEEESLDLGKEKIEWVVGAKSGDRFKRLRRGASALRKVVTDSDDDVEMGSVEEEKENKSDGDDSSDEDWGKNVGKEVCESEEDDVELVDENEMDEEELVEEKDEETPKGSRVSKTDSRKRKTSEVTKSGGEKKSRTDKDTILKGFKASVVEPLMKIGEADRVVKGLEDNILDGDALARFGARESEKFRFLGVDRRDAIRRRPTDENYDPRTLYLPPDFVKKLTGGQRQWWEFKSKHMDKVVFFKMGKFYELFEMDAHVGAKELDIQYMKGEQPHCGFPEKNFSVNIEKLVRKGYRVLVVEQTETPDQLEQRRKETGSKDKVVKREICAVVTKGTLTDGEMLLTNPDASYLMALTEGGETLTNQTAEHNFGVCLVDVATKKIMLGQFKDDQDCSALSSLLSEMRPVEIIKPAKVLSSATERTIVRQTRNPLVNNLVPLSEFWDSEKTIHELGIFYKRISCQPSSAYPSEGKILGDGSSFLPKMLSELATEDKNGSLALSALGGAIYYLRQAFLDESLLRFAKFESLPYCDFSNVNEKQHMVLDAAALENLEIFENSRNGGYSGTLYAQLNQCVTASGKRLLKTWLARPLYNTELIKERQDAVAILRGENLPYSLEFRKALSRLPDMERLIARMFSSIEASGRNGDKVVLYEDTAKKQVQEFISTLRGCETMAEACSSLRAILKHDKSRRLLHLLTPGQILPNISSSIKYFKDAFDWVEAHNSGRVIPHEGADDEYDCACKTVEEFESSLKKHLKEQRKLLGDASINYVTVGKDEYLLEVPESLSGSVPHDYELCSSKKGVSRYWTPTIKKLLKELSQAKSEKESALKSISQRLIGRFCEHQEKWRQLVSATAELDVLISLAFASDSYEGVRCRPVISGSTSDDVPHLSATGLGHPVLRGDSLGRGSFVPNNVKIGGAEKASFILLTGPNMGGKSTLLRQVCLAVILAQIGADVPAETFEVSPVDRICVRMGAKDHIMAGQSTFLTELSETAVMLTSATRNSLVVLDELGRGTATSDGQAIAESVLEHFIDKVQCRGLFSTHYHRLSVDYQTNPKVSLCHMACQVGEGIGGVEEVTFLYRLTPGACPKSYGVNVARLAGLPDYVLQRAVIKSQEFEALYGKKQRKTDHKMAAMIKQIISSVASDSNYSASKDSLSELHSMANTFLQLI
ncbi:DNA mismatch repair protein MutS core domain superfamily [Arabidopsis thaliana x Arabidopsis arenosa]|uniref:DNA mismatch repair protein n=1 Tax=Arabidopsis thaliana x Arabidopsis arenosa TaxID=1240361 RepID=A0A8T1Z386_9BRAS|nr:DNA mismatch repair protein MutS core domain superfamily [Arabidopsis thaliana x Arabidopsis arenosa]